MLEGTPGLPYGGLLSCFNQVEDNMKRRRAAAEALLGLYLPRPTLPNLADRTGFRDLSAAKA